MPSAKASALKVFSRTPSANKIFVRPLYKRTSFQIDNFVLFLLAYPKRASPYLCCPGPTSSNLRCPKCTSLESGLVHGPFYPRSCPEYVCTESGLGILGEEGADTPGEAASSGTCQFERRNTDQWSSHQNSGHPFTSSTNLPTAFLNCGLMHAACMREHPQLRKPEKPNKRRSYHHGSLFSTPITL